jgi:hypothetical protein
LRYFPSIRDYNAGLEERQPRSLNYPGVWFPANKNDNRPGSRGPEPPTFRVKGGYGFLRILPSLKLEKMSDVDFFGHCDKFHDLWKNGNSSDIKPD